MPITLSDYALTTLETAKEHLGIPPATLTYDELIKRYINVATQRIETYCDRLLKQRTGIEEFHDGIAGNRLLLNQWPALKPTELWIDPTGEFTDIENKLDLSEYNLDKSAKGEGIGVVLVGGNYFPNGVRNIKVVYDAGYTSIPADLEDACLWTVDFLYDMRTNHSITMATKGKNQENTTFRGDLPEIVKDNLDLYRRVEWGSAFRAVSTR